MTILQKRFHKMFSRNAIRTARSNSVNPNKIEPLYIPLETAARNGNMKGPPRWRRSFFGDSNFCFPFGPFFLPVLVKCAPAFHLQDTYVIVAIYTSKVPKRCSVAELFIAFECGSLRFYFRPLSLAVLCFPTSLCWIPVLLTVNATFLAKKTRVNLVIAHHLSLLCLLLPLFSIYFYCLRVSSLSVVCFTLLKGACSLASFQTVARRINAKYLFRGCFIFWSPGVRRSH